MNRIVEPRSHEDTKVLEPVLRFAEFHNPWKVLKLGEVANYISYGLTVRPSYVEVGIPLISAKEIRSGQIDYVGAAKISQKTFNSLSKKATAQKGDIFLSKTGSIGFVAYVDTIQDIAVTQNIAVIRIDGTEVEHKFVLQQLKTHSFFKQAISKVNQSTIMDLQLQDIRKLIISLPEKTEQQKIADFLSSVDKKIEQLTQKHRLLTEYKKGVMQQIFTQQIRFKDNQGNDYPEWEEVELGEALDYLQPTKYLVKDTDYSDEFSTPVLTAGKTFVLGYTDEKQGIFKELLPAIIFDDFTTAFKYVDFPFKAKSSAMKILIAKEDLNIKYIFEAMQTIRFEVGGHERHWISKFSKLPIPYPAMEEQQKIANFLTEIDNKIDQAWSTLEQTKAFKKGLLQKMFV